MKIEQIMKTEEIPQKDESLPTDAEAYNRIAELEQEALIEGATDFERVAYETIKSKLANHILTSVEALDQAIKIAEKRQNYH